MKLIHTIDFYYSVVQGQPRPRFANGHMYQPRTEFETEFEYYLRCNPPKKYIDNVPYHIEIWIRQDMRRSDADNIEKSIQDCLVRAKYISDDKWNDDCRRRRKIQKTDNIYGAITINPPTGYPEGYWKHLGEHNNQPYFKNSRHFLYFNGDEWNIHTKLDDNVLNLYSSHPGFSRTAMNDIWRIADDSTDIDVAKKFHIGIQRERVKIKTYELEPMDDWDFDD